MLHDLRYGFRSLIKNPGFTAVAVLCLAVAIAANSTIFSLVDGSSLRPLPVDDPDGLVRVFSATERYAFGRVSYRDLLDFRQQAESLSALAGAEYRGFILEDDQPAMRTNSQVVTENYFDVLGIEAQFGRFFGADDATEQVVVISHSLWQRRFGGDPEVVGRRLLISGQPYTLIGVARRGFRGTAIGRDPDIWVPAGSNAYLSSPAYLQNRVYQEFSVFGRLRPGASLDEARAELTAVVRNLERAYPATNKGRRVLVMSEWEFRLENSETGFILMGMVALVLLIACANVANLLLARAEQRRREIAVRLSLGSSRGRLVRHLLTEGTLLAGFGAAAGLLLAWWLISALPAMLMPPTDYRMASDFRLDERVLAFTLITAALTVLLFALMPALRASRVSLSTALKGLAPTAIAHGRRLGPRGGLLVAQMAISLVLLVGTGLLVKAFLANLNADFGFSERNLVVAQVAFRGPAQQRASFWRELGDRISAVPGVEQAAFAMRAPLSGSGSGVATEVLIPGQEKLRIKYARVTSNYFQTLGIRLIRGQLLSDEDSPKAPKSVVINETMAQRYFPDGDIIDQVIRVSDKAQEHRIIGIVQDTKIRSITEPPEPYLYLPFSPGYGGMRTLLVETSGDAASRAELIRSEIVNVDSRSLVYTLTTIRDLIHANLHPQWISASAVGILGLLSLLLAAIGLYGVVSYVVARRTREIGIRMALGAQSRDALGLVLRQGLRPTLIGVAIGLAGAIGLTRILSSWLYSVNPRDPLVFAIATAVMIATALVATLIPARNATRVRPMEALREE